MITDKKLKKLIDFTKCECKLSASNMEELRGNYSLAMQALKDELQDCIRYVHLVQHIARKEHNAELLADTENTLRHKLAQAEMFSSVRLV